MALGDAATERPVSEAEREAWRERWRALRAATLELEAVLERNGIHVTRLTELEANRDKAVNQAKERNNER